MFERFFSDANSSPRGRECSRVKTASNPFSLSRTSISYGPKLILSPGPLIIKLRTLLKNYTSQDFLLLSGDPAIIGLACTIASDINNGRFNLLKWDRQEKVYYPLEIDLYEKGKIDE